MDVFGVALLEGMLGFPVEVECVRITDIRILLAVSDATVLDSNEVEDGGSHGDDVFNFVAGGNVALLEDADDVGEGLIAALLDGFVGK